MNMCTRQLYLVAYDVADAKRLRNALNCVRAYATGGQKSVHECWLTEAERHQLIESSQSILDPQEDRFLLIRLDPRQPITTLGCAIEPSDPAWFYIG